MRLIIEDSDGRRRALPLELGEAIVGRDKNNSIRLNERNVSRRHLRILRSQEKVVVEDLGSYNGVFLNGDRLRGQREVAEGDVLRVGDFQLELRGGQIGRSMQGSTQSPAEALEATALIQPTDLASDVSRFRDAEPPPFPKAARLVGVSSSVFGVEYEISGDEVVIGRVAGNAIVIDHRSVSREHAKIVVDGDTFRLVDLKSANGTLVNGNEYTEVELRSGDLVELGHIRLCFVAPGEDVSLALQEHATLEDTAGHCEERSTHAVEPEPWLEPETSSRRRVGLFIGVAVLVISGAAATVLLFRDREMSVGDRADREIAAMAAQGSGAVRDLSERMTAAIADKDWHQADEIAETILVLDEDHAWAKEVQRIAVMEIESRESYERAFGLSQQERLEEAHDALELVAPDSHVADEAEALMSRLGVDPARAAQERDEEKNAETHVRKLLARAIEWILIDEPKRALDPLHRCVQSYPNYCRCHRALGIVYAKLQDPVSAEQSYRSYIELCPEAEDVEQIARMLDE